MKKRDNSVIFLPETKVQYRVWVSPSIALAACGTSVAYVNAGSRVRITALSGLTNVRISGRALYFFRNCRVALISAKNYKRQRRKRQSVTAKREKLQTPKVLTAILT